MLTEVQMIVRLLCAALLGGVVGIEREVHDKVGRKISK